MYVNPNKVNCVGGLHNTPTVSPQEENSNSCQKPCRRWQALCTANFCSGESCHISVIATNLFHCLLQSIPAAGRGWTQPLLSTLISRYFSPVLITRFCQLVMLQQLPIWAIRSSLISFFKSRLLVINSYCKIGRVPKGIRISGIWILWLVTTNQNPNTTKTTVQYCTLPFVASRT